MGLFSCCNTSTVRPSSVPVASRNSTGPASRAVTTTLGKNNAPFAQNNVAPRTIQYTPENKVYWSNKMNCSPEHLDTLTHRFNAISATILLLLPDNPVIKIRPERIENLKEHIKSNFQLDQKITRSDTLISRNIKVQEQINNLVSNPKKIEQLKKDPLTSFFNGLNFDVSNANTFNQKCLAIPLNKHLEDFEPGSYDDKHLLMLMGRIYAQKGLLKNQLPVVKNKLQELQQVGYPDKDFIDILQSSISSAEVALRNMEQPERKAIFEKLAPKARPTSMDHNPEGHSYLDTFDYNPIFDHMSDAEVESIYSQLKKIPFELAP